METKVYTETTVKRTVMTEFTEDEAKSLLTELLPICTRMQQGAHPRPWIGSEIFSTASLATDLSGYTY